MPKVEKIMFTDVYGQPYIYVLFKNKINPIWYQSGSLQMYEFTHPIQIGDLNRKNALIISDHALTDDPKRAINIISGKDGHPYFYVYVSNDLEK